MAKKPEKERQTIYGQSWSNFSLSCIFGTKNFIGETNTPKVKKLMWWGYYRKQSKDQCCYESIIAALIKIKRRKTMIAAVKIDSLSKCHNNTLSYILSIHKYWRTSPSIFILLFMFELLAFINVTNCRYVSCYINTLERPLL